MNRTIQELVLLRPHAGEINIVCPAITPTLGTELFTDPGMEIDPATNWPAVLTPTTHERSNEQKHSESYSLKMAMDAANEGARQIINTATGTWYQVFGWIYVTVGNAKLTHSVGGVNHFVRAVQNGAAWNEVLETIRESAGGPQGFNLYSAAAAVTCYFDDLSLRVITLSSMLSGPLGTHKPAGTYQCTPTVGADTQCGLCIRYAGEDNLVLATVDRQAAQAKLLKKIGGVWTVVIAGAITYGAANALKVIIAANTTDYSLYYNGVQVGVTTAINDAGLGQQVRGFNAYAGNTVGTVTTSQATL